MDFHSSKYKLFNNFLYSEKYSYKLQNTDYASFACFYHSNKSDHITDCITTDGERLNALAVICWRVKCFNKMEKLLLRAIEVGDINAMYNLAGYYVNKYGLLGNKIFKELTEYCFHPQRLLRLCNIYNIEMTDYMDII